MNTVWKRVVISFGKVGDTSPVLELFLKQE